MAGHFWFVRFCYTFCENSWALVDCRLKPVEGVAFLSLVSSAHKLLLSVISFVASGERFIVLYIIRN